MKRRKFCHEVRENEMSGAAVHGGDESFSPEI
jgi:hypothetical protein